MPRSRHTWHVWHLYLCQQGASIHCILATQLKMTVGFSWYIGCLDIVQFNCSHTSAATARYCCCCYQQKSAELSKCRCFFVICVYSVLFNMCVCHSFISEESSNVWSADCFVILTTAIALLLILHYTTTLTNTNDISNNLTMWHFVAHNIVLATFGPSSSTFKCEHSSN